MSPADGGDELAGDAAGTLRSLLGRRLTPEEFEDLKQGLSEKVVLDALLYSEWSYLVLGSYGTEDRDNEEKERLTTVRDALNDRHHGHHAFLLEGLPEFHPNWVVQFVVVARRVDVSVGVFEHSVGGHEFEAGVLAAVPPRELWVLKRAYGTESAERESYDGMTAHFFELVEERDELREWTDENELEALARAEVPGLDARDS